MYSMPLRDDRGLPCTPTMRMDYDARGAGVVRGAGAGLRPGGGEGLGLEAVDTARYRFSHFSWSYGCELEALTGQPYQADTKRSEAERYVTEALLVSPISGRPGCRTSGLRAPPCMQVALSTVYGKETIYV